MTDAFVPLSPAAWSAGQPGAAASAAHPSAPAQPLPRFDALTGGGAVHSGQNCGQPAVTLQRKGDVVTAIRVQCGCGQVIELNCVY